MQQTSSAALAATLLSVIVTTILSAILPGSAFALEGTVYVTDELRLGLYTDEQTTGQPYRTFSSGDKLEVLERALMSVMVRSEDGAEGWVKSAFLVTTPTAKTRLASLEREHATIVKELTAAQAARASADTRIEGLQAKLETAQQGLTNLPALERQNQSLTAQIEVVGTTVPRYWLAVAALGALIIGALAGYFWLDRRVRKQFGGVRVY